MNLSKSIFFIALIGAGVAVPLVMRRNLDNQLRGKLELLQQQKERLALLEADNARLAKRPAPTNSPAELSPEKLSELLKLRSEVGAMRSQTNAIPQLEAENRQLRTAAANASRNSLPADSPPGPFVPRESLTFAGYATPEAAMQSYAWAMSKGDLKAFWQSIDPAQREALAKQIGAKSDEDFAAQMTEAAAHLPGYRILKKEYISDDEALIQIAEDASETNGTILKMRKVGGEWKLADPLH